MTLLPDRGSTTFSAASAMPSPTIRSRPDSARSRRPSSTLVPSRRTTSGTLELDLLGRRDDAAGDHVAAHDAAEDVDQDALHAGVGEQDPEGRGHPLLGGAAAHVQEVGRLAAVVLDDVHGGHGQAGAVDHAADVAVELDVVEVELGGLHLERLLLVEVAQLGDVLVAEQGVVVEVILASSAITWPSVVVTRGLISASDASVSP